MLNHPVEEKNTKTFTFDHSFCSTDPKSHDFASQETVCYHLGSGVVENAFAGYNACIFAYGQTGSGKSYTMMGTPDQPGIIPRVCDDVRNLSQRLDYGHSSSDLYSDSRNYQQYPIFQS